MGNLFASKKPSKSNAFAERDRVILQLKSQRDLLSRKIKKYDNDSDRLKLQAKQLVHEQKKDKALVTLRKKKFLDNTIKNLERQLEEVENMTTQLEFTQIEMQVVENLKIGNSVLTKLHQMMSINDVEKIMEDTKEGIAHQNEIDDILSKGLNDEDEEEVEKEFDQLFGITTENLPEPEGHALVNDETADQPIKIKVPTKQRKIALEAS